VNPSVRSLLVLLFLLARTPAFAQDPDELYRQRENLSSAKRAAEIWSANAGTDFEAAWKLARAAYWIGGHAPEGERRAALERGVVAGETATRLKPDRPEGHYWLAADMGALAESFGVSQGMKYRSRIKAELERVAAIDAAWEQASAPTALGRWYYLVPRLFGGSRSKADEHFRRALDQFPNSVTALVFLAESLTAQKKTDEARTLLQRAVDAPIVEEWAPEVRDYRRKAADRLRALSAGREP
jgi:tetratricopeptide (TPR) repeat protein